RGDGPRRRAGAEAPGGGGGRGGAHQRAGLPPPQALRGHQEILAAGINVICAFNVQHLESLNDLIERVTGIKVRETVPDTFLKSADQVVNLDLSVEDLIDRLKSGKIYAPDKVPHALENFFTPEKLRSLRELAPREVAEAV